MECLLGSMAKGLAAGNSQSWGRPGFRGFVVTVRWGQGRIHPGPQETPEDGRHGAPAALSRGQAAFSSGLGGIQGSEPEVRWDLQRSSGRVPAILAHLCRAVSRGKSQPGNLGFVEGSVHTEGAAPFLQPLSPPQPRFPSHHPARGRS